MAEPFLQQDDKESFRGIQQQLRDLSKQIRTFERNLNTIGTDNDTENFRNNLNHRISQVTNKCKEVRQSLVELEANGNANPYKIEKFKKNFTSEVDKFKKVVNDINIKERQCKPKPSRHSSTDKTPLARQGADYQTYDMTNVAQQNEQQQRQSQDQMIEATYHVDELEQREEKMVGMLDNLTELNDIYKDLNELVEDQQEHIDHLDTNVETAKEDVQSGVKHLDKAAGHQKKYRKKMCILLIILLIVGAVVTIVFLSTNKK